MEGAPSWRTTLRIVKIYKDVYTSSMMCAVSSVRILRRSQTHEASYRVLIITAADG